MSKTIKQLADELGIDKQRVYRYIKKNHINEVHQKHGVMYYDETAETLIKQAFSENKVHHEAHQNYINETVNESVIELLRNELQAKNEQIEKLQSDIEREREHSREMASKLATLADQAQKLQLVSSSTMIEDKDNPPKKHWWQRKRTQE